MAASVEDRVAAVLGWTPVTRGWRDGAGGDHPALDVRSWSTTVLLFSALSEGGVLHIRIDGDASPNDDDASVMQVTFTPRKTKGPYLWGCGEGPTRAYATTMALLELAVLRDLIPEEETA